MEYNGVIIADYPEKPFVVYTITSEDVTDKSIYIGITTDYIQRAYKHSVNRVSKKNCKYSVYEWMNDVINNKGLKVILKIIEKDYSEDEAIEREIALVKLYKEMGYKVVNGNEGGKGNKGNAPWNKGIKMSPEIVKKFSDSHIGSRKGEKRKSHSDYTKNLISLRNKEKMEKGWTSDQRKKVYKYDEEGSLVEEFPCLLDAANNMGVHIVTMGQWCRGVYTPRNNNYKWSYDLLQTIKN